MKKLYPIIALILMIPIFSFAQSNYKAGYIINSKGDTVKGFIDYREWDSAPVIINFKRSLNDNSAVKYGAGDIRNFGVGAVESYRSYTGPISTDPTNLEKVDYNRDTSFRTGTVFLRLIEKGNRLALYIYKDELKERFFIGDAPDYEPRELIFRLFHNPDYDYNYPTNQDGSRNIRTVAENIYRRQLSALAVKYNELNQNLIFYIAKSEYTTDDILTIVGKINHISKREFAKSSYDGSPFNFFIGAGINSTTTAPDPVAPYYTAGGTSYTSYLPFVSLGINAYVNPATKKLQLRIELSVAESKYQSLYVDKVLPYEPTEVVYNKLAISLSPQIIYNVYNADNFKVFIGVGMVFSSYKYTNSYYGSQNHDGSEASEAANNPFVFNTTDNTFLGKAGIQIGKKFVFYVSAQNEVADTQGGYFKLTSTNKMAGINYYF